MKKILFFFLILFNAAFCQQPRHIDIRFAGVVTEVKLIGINDNEITCLIVANSQYITKNVAFIPRIYIGDSLFEYWINYQKVGIATSHDLVIYKTAE